MSTTTVKTNAQKLEEQAIRLENAKIKAEEAQKAVNDKIAANENYTSELEVMNNANEEYKAMQLASIYYDFLFNGSAEKTPIIKLIEAEKYTISGLKAKKDATTGKVVAYTFKDTEAFHDILWFATKYGAGCDNIASLNDTNAVKMFDKLYYTMQGVQAVRYHKPIEHLGVKRDYEAYLALSDDEKKTAKNPFSKTSLGKLIVKACEAFMGITPKLTARIDGGKDTGTVLINYLQDSMLDKDKKTQDKKLVNKKEYVKSFLHAMHCVVCDGDIKIVYETESKENVIEFEDIKFEIETNAPAETPAENVEAPTEAPTNEAPAEAEAK